MTIAPEAHYFAFDTWAGRGGGGRAVAITSMKRAQGSAVCKLWQNVLQKSEVGTGHLQATLRIFASKKRILRLCYCFPLLRERAQMLVDASSHFKFTHPKGEVFPKSRADQEESDWCGCQGFNASVIQFRVDELPKYSNYTVLRRGVIGKVQNPN